ncbi:MAG: hypothetical protein GF320_18740, partial [Armatimonadia bacterium]|nr:hypothetical protein [Armatimonadia bacterium]
FPYYYRHMLRQYIVGECDEQDMVVQSPEEYKERRIRLRLGQKVSSLDPDSRTLYLAHMEKVSYTRLLVCVGSVPRIPEVHYRYREHLTVMSTLRHARALRERMGDIRRVVMCGGDMVSFRIATTLAAHDKEVIFLVDEDAFWPLELTDERREDFAAALEEKGVTVRGDDVLTGVESTGTEESGDRYVVRTKRDAEIHCDLVGAFFGLTPAIEWLQGTGLDLERGVLVDEYLRTNRPSIYAAGDCAEIYRPDLRNYWVSRGWPNALRLGEVAAKNLLGGEESVDEPSTNVLQVDGIKVSTAWWREF